MFKGNNLERVVTALIAMLLIAGSLVITILSAMHAISPQVPQWLLTATTVVLGYYFGHYHAGTSSSGPTTAGTGADVASTLAQEQPTTAPTQTAATSTTQLPMQAG